MLDLNYLVINAKEIVPHLTYEGYLMELLNASPYFCAKSEQVPFARPQREDHGECDAITPGYSIDFKVLIDQEEMDSRVRVGSDSLEAQEEPVRKNMLAELLNLGSWAYETGEYSKSIASLRKNLRKDKNLLLFYPYEFADDLLNCTQTLSLLFESALSFLLAERENLLPGKETFLCAVVGHFFLVFQWEEGAFVLRDKVSDQLIPLYGEMKSLVAD